MASLYVVKSILVLDSEGGRIAAQYFTDDFPTTKEQLNFEKTLFKKCYQANAEIIMHEDVIGLYKSSADCFFCVTGGKDENELILLSVLNALTESLALLLRGQIDKRTLLENLDYVLLAVDEIVDGGVIMESDPQLVATRVSLRGADSDVPLSEQTISQALQTAKEQIAKSLLK